MIVRLDFGGEARRKRSLRVSASAKAGVQIVARLGNRLPFRDNCADEIFLDHTLAHVEDFPGVLEEIWRISKPGTLVHLRLPHASSSWALSRDPRHARHFTLETFNYFHPLTNPNTGCDSRASYQVEYAKLYLTGRRGSPRGLALARGPLSRVVEAFANQGRGMQYRWERWLAPLVGGFEEFYVVLSAVKQPAFG
jgi:hypothetical protein